jgi:hypothetical protein
MAAFALSIAALALSADWRYELILTDKVIVATPLSTQWFSMSKIHATKSHRVIERVTRVAPLV